MYKSNALDIEGIFGKGASISILSPESWAALTVFLPKTAILVLFCLKSGKFLNKDSMPEGLKNTNIS